MSDHTLVMFKVFEDWNEEFVVPYICFDSIRIRFERKRSIELDSQVLSVERYIRLIRRSLVLSGIYV